MKKRLWAFVAVIALVIAAGGGDGADTTTTAAGGDEPTTTAGGGDEPTTTAGGGGGEGVVVGISWNNYAQPRWAKADGPAIIAAVESEGGTVIEDDANDSSERQPAGVER